MDRRAPPPNSVLVVDDDPAGRSMLGLALRAAGFKVYLAASGPEALSLLAARPCAILVTDASMNPMDGFELSLRAKTLRPGLRIAMISALRDAADADGHPIERVFAKPVSPAELARWADAGARA